MAVLKGIKFAVVSEGETLQEYDDKDAEETTDSISMFVEAKSNSTFGIDVELVGCSEIACPYLFATLLIDDRDIMSQCINVKIGGKCRIDGATFKEGAGVVKYPFKFRTTEHRECNA